MVELLLEHAGSEEERQKLLTSSGHNTSPLDRAASGGHAKVVRMLLRATVDKSSGALSGVRSLACALPAPKHPHKTPPLPQPTCRIVTNAALLRSL